MMSIKDTSYTLIVKTHAGLEDVLAGEVQQAGGKNVEVLNRAVKCSGNMAVLYRINYVCRTALRVLKEIKTFEAENEHELYREVKKMAWQTLLDPGKSIAINATVNRSDIKHSHYAALKTKDAIVDKIRDITGQRPNVDLDSPDLRLHLHITGTRCTLLADSSGDSLHKRGYRLRQGEAPISEVLAAGMLLLSGWDGITPLLDPMCGSATIPVEAYMMAARIPSGYFRKNFGFMLWPDFDRHLWEAIVAEEKKKIIDPPCEIEGSDVSLKALQLAGEIIENAGFAETIKLRQVAFENSKPMFSKPGFIITNPPYGERIKKNDLNAFYKTIGDVLKSRYSGFIAWIITSDFEALKSVGLKTSHKIKLFNGPLECRFVKYELYRGSRKASKAEIAENPMDKNHSDDTT
jgi:putative N6-adenine-specific DNA methylase